MIEFVPQSKEIIKLHTDQKKVRFAVIADTHVPDRVETLHPELIRLIQANQVDAILHCGDVIDTAVIDELSELAPVFTVLGNRDAFFSKADFPFKLEIQVYERKIGMYHGFLSIKHYFPDKLKYILQGYHFEYYYHIGQKLFPEADILCYGHTHTAEIRRYTKQLVINPGTAGPYAMTGESSFVIMDIHKSGKMNAFFVPLLGYMNKNHAWEKCS